KELSDISGICRKYKIPLFLDGARLGYGLMSSENDLSLREIAEMCDVFYIGGTKVGALCGEAVVFTHGNRPDHFLTSVKKRGALLAKGRLIGVQFDALFTDNLYFRIGEHGIKAAERLKEILLSHGMPLFIDSPTNQQFAILENALMQKLGREVLFEFWEKKDENHSVVRFATSWSTTEDDLIVLETALDKLIR
ncbi:MAG: low specificity L-threonine aldolase, partial [Clostridia bacterium]|nr:low specificity L-threonine aldolase [Clostridia bacterium]